MIDVFRGLKALIKKSSVTIDSSIFRLHYSISVTFMLAFSLIVTARQYVGNPIDCVHTKDIPEDVLNTYCWIHSTYTIPSAFWKRIGIDVAHPGIDKTIDPDERRYVRYYQWVCFCLFFQVSTTFPAAGQGYTPCVTKRVQADSIRYEWLKLQFSFLAVESHKVSWRYLCGLPRIGF